METCLDTNDLETLFLLSVLHLLDTKYTPDASPMRTIERTKGKISEFTKKLIVKKIEIANRVNGKMTKTEAKILEILTTGE